MNLSRMAPTFMPDQDDPMAGMVRHRSHHVDVPGHSPVPQS